METKPAFVLLDSDEPHIAKLPAHQAEPLRLVHTGIGYKAAAEMLRIPLNTLKTRIHRGRDKIMTMRAALAAASTSQDQLEAADD